MSALTDMIAKQKLEAINAQAATESALKASEAPTETAPGLAGFNIRAHKSQPSATPDGGIQDPAGAASRPQKEGILPESVRLPADGVLSESGSGGRPAVPAANPQAGAQGLAIPASGDNASGGLREGATGRSSLADQISASVAEANASTAIAAVSGFVPANAGGSQPIPGERTPQPNESNPDAPPRDLPPEITQQMKEFVEGLDSVYACFHDPDLLGHAIKNIMITLQKHPKFMQLVSDIDVATMVRGMRDTLGMVQIAKQKTKRKGTTKKGEDALAKSMKVGDVLSNLLALKV